MKGNKEDWDKLGINFDKLFNEVADEARQHHHVEERSSKVTDTSGCKEEDWCAGNLGKNEDGSPSYKCVNFVKECPCTCANFKSAAEA